MNSMNRNTFLAVVMDAKILTVRFSNVPVAMPADTRDSAKTAMISVIPATAVKVVMVVMTGTAVEIPEISVKDSTSPANRVKQDVAAGPAKRVAVVAAAEAVAGDKER